MQENQIKVSVCIVTYNHDRYIEDCLASVVGQQLDARIEVLVGDDLSTDQTRKIISRYAKRYPGLIRPVFHEKNIGGANNYRSLIAQATGDYIAHLDGDDYWLPGKLAAQIQLLDENPECSAVYANANVINNSSELVARFNAHLPERFDLNFLVRRGNFLNASSIMYRSQYRNLILDQNDQTLDYQYSILLASKGCLGYINRPLVSYRINSTTSIIRANVELVREQYWKAILCAEKMGADINALQQCTTKFYNSICRAAISGRSWKGMKYWAQRLRRDSTFVSWSVLFRAIASLPIDFLNIFLRRLARKQLKGGAEVLFDRS